VRRFLDARAERAAGRARDTLLLSKRIGICVRTAKLARLASAASATNESGGEAEIAGGVGVRRGAATRSLRRARGAAHSEGAAADAVLEEHPTKEFRNRE
jgi:hypothetical protein